MPTTMATATVKERVWRTGILDHNATQSLSLKLTASPSSGGGRYTMVADGLKGFKSSTSCAE